MTQANGADNPPTEHPRLGDPLPRAREAVVDERKLTEYTLNHDHPIGRHKARLFAAVLGIEVDDSEYLRREIIGALPAGRIMSIRSGEHARTYGVVLDIRGRNGRVAPVLAVVPGDVPNAGAGWPVAER